MGNDLGWNVLCLKWFALELVVGAIANVERLFPLKEKQLKDLIISSQPLIGLDILLHPLTSVADCQVLV